MIETLKQKRTGIMALSLAGIILCAAGIVTLAVLLSKTGELVNTFEPGNVTTEVREEFEPTETATVFRKEPVVANTGKNACYVRVRVTASPEEQLEIGGWDRQNWTEKEDGYYYYNKALESGESTTPLFKEVSVKKEYEETIEGFEVNVYQEAVQAKMNAADGSSTTDAAQIWEAYEANVIPESFKN